MKLRVELEVTAEEVPLATELLAVLRSLTENVQLITTNGAAGKDGASIAPLSHPAPPSAGPPAAPPSTPLGPPDHALPPALPPVPAAVPQPAAPAASAAPVPPGPPPGREFWIAFPPNVPPEQQLATLIASMEYSEHPEALAQQLEDTILHGHPNGPSELFPKFVSAWMAQTLNKDLPAQERSAVSFVLPLAHVSPDFKTRLRDAVIPNILKHLTIKRPPSQDRSEYYVHAEAFAALVSIELVAIQGALQTMRTLLKKPETRGAAITMLGKTVELCGHMIPEKVDQKVQEEVRGQVAGITEEEFKYDVSYIMEAMGWAAGAPHGPGGGVTPGRPKQLHPVQSCASHTDLIFSIAVDADRHQFVSGGKDSFIQVWTEDGKQVQRLDLGDKYASALDFHPKLSLLLCCGLTKPQNPPYFLAAYAASQPNGFAPKGFLARPEATGITCLRALSDTTGFLTGESIKLPGGQSYEILFYDLGSAASFQSLQPASTFRGHNDIITSLARFPGEANLFVSGGKDSMVCLWDLRTPTAVAGFGEAQPGGRATAHGTSMVTSLDVSGHLLLSGGVDRTVKLWDLRRAAPGSLSPPLATVEVPGSVVLKVAANTTNRLAAVSAMTGLFTLDFTVETQPQLAKVEVAWPGGRRPATYHDVKWNEGAGMLYAAGKDFVVDMYALA